MKQNEAVFKITVAVLAEHGIEFKSGQDVKPLLNDSIETEICSQLMAGFKDGSIDLKGGVETKYPTDQALKTYVSGLMSNWYRKGKELNGNVEYVAKNPGSRAGSSDPQLRELKKVLSQVTTDDDKAMIQGYIDARLSELNAAKSKAKPIDFSVLPAELAAKFAK
jgi:hypothetical protein